MPNMTPTILLFVVLDWACNAQQDTCTCDHGTPATGGGCLYGGHVCYSCDPHYKLTGHECVSNPCTCSHGTPATGGECNWGGEVCDHCDAGYYRNSLSHACEQNQCSCHDGNVATDCSTNGDENCVSCNGGYHLFWATSSERGCAVNQCTCSHGGGETGANCPNSGRENCALCDAGYHLFWATSSERGCAANQCTCSHGSGAVGAACSENGQTKCVSCGAGYYLKNNGCVENQCSCSRGSGAAGTACSKNGQVKCVSCNAGYYLKNSGCVANQCSCSHGSGAVGTACSKNGQAKCVSCDAGYNLNSIACEATTTTTTVTSVKGTFQSQCPGQCLSLTAGDTSDGTSLSIQSCKDASHWSFHLKQLVLDEAVVRHCVDVGLTDNGSPVLIFACNGGHNQQWEFDSTANHIRLTGSNKCVRLESCASKPVIWECDGSQAESWVAGSAVSKQVFV